MRDLTDWLRKQWEGLSFRKIVVLVGIFLLAAGLAQMFSLDLAFLMAGDLMAYFELFAIVSMIAARSQLQLLVRASKDWLRRVRPPLRRGRLREILTRAARALLPPRSDDEDGPVLA
jgi:hypothetical protein